ncbi:hypothetical protein B0H12DRAFT_155486 [Mycena haematopus]|nr:hypothetical protein B0H12DRAFT_155486 [Mycena haematopus]
MCEVPLAAKSRMAVFPLSAPHPRFSLLSLPPQLVCCSLHILHFYYVPKAASKELRAAPVCHSPIGLRAKIQILCNDRPSPPTNLDNYEASTTANRFLKRQTPMASLEPYTPSSKSAMLPPGANISVGEYEAGRVICEVCGRGVLFRDDSGSFTLKHWEAHRLTCSPHRPVQYPPQEPSNYNQLAYTAPNAVSGPSSSSLQIGTVYAHSPPIKRRRAKRTEEERIDYLRTDPHVAEFEPYRVLCAGCNKWIKLRPNSTYCSIPWDAHRRICLEKKM